MNKLQSKLIVSWIGQLKGKTWLPAAWGRRDQHPSASYQQSWRLLSPPRSRTSGPPLLCACKWPSLSSDSSAQTSSNLSRKTHTKRWTEKTGREVPHLRSDGCEKWNITISPNQPVRFEGEGEAEAEPPEGEEEEEEKRPWFEALEEQYSTEEEWEAETTRRQEGFCESRQKRENTTKDCWEILPLPKHR